MADVNQLKDEAAEAILEAVKVIAPEANPSMLKDLAEAYALVVAQGGGPLKKPAARMGSM